MDNAQLWENEDKQGALARLSKTYSGQYLESGGIVVNPDNLQKRYDLAIERLPLPAFFREAVTVLRMDIKQQIKNGEDYLAHLQRLYNLAVWFSFCDMSREERVPCVGFVIFEHIIGSVITSLPFTYSEIGYEKLSLLKKTDVRLLVKNYGEPENHTTLNEKYRTLWESYIDKLIIIEDKKRSDINNGLITFDEEQLASNPIGVNKSLRESLFVYVLE